MFDFLKRSAATTTTVPRILEVSEYNQVSDAEGALHAVGTRADVDAHNDMIDEANNAWVMDMDWGSRREVELRPDTALRVWVLRCVQYQECMKRIGSYLCKIH